MQILINEDLKKYTTVRIGGIADKLLVPETTDELLELVRDYSPQYFVGGGSNLLINDRHFEKVVCLRSFDTAIENLGSGKYRVGGSVYLSKLINKINNDGFGGIEYLSNVPGLVGGAVAMNAGTGKITNRSISDYILSVTIIRDGSLYEMDKKECDFSFRNSIFKKTPGLLVTSILFQFSPMSKDETALAKKQKMDYYRIKQDSSHPNFGSVFCQYNRYIMSVVKLLRVGNRNVHFSGKTSNWILNEKNGTYKEAIFAIRTVELLHKLLLRKCIREVIVWE